MSGAHDPAQLLRAWGELEPGEREMPEVAIHAAQRMVALRGDLALARAWLLPVWERMVEQPQSLGESLRVKLVRALEAGLDSVDADWLARIESAQRNNPRDANLQYLAGMACMRRQLWGKAQQLLTQAGWACRTSTCTDAPGRRWRNWPKRATMPSRPRRPGSARRKPKTPERDTRCCVLLRYQNGSNFRQP